MTRKEPLVSDDVLEGVVREMPEAFTTLDFSVAFQRIHPETWKRLVHRYGLYGSGTRYSALTYLGNRLSSYSRRHEPNLLEPTPTGWKPQESRHLRRATSEELKRFGSPWIVVFHRTPER